MPRLTKRHLPHRVSIRRLEGEGADGPVFSAPQRDVPAYIEQKSKLVIDRRSASETAGQEITANNFGVLLLADDALPGSLILLAAGTPREREASVITSEYYEHPRAPGHVEVWTD